MITDIRIKPISNDMVSVQINCECGRTAKTRVDTAEDGFSFSVLMNGALANRMNGAPDTSFRLRCGCGRTYGVRVQNDHCHVGLAAA